jgi:hypothetical protein
MNDQEREVVADIFRRLEEVANQPRDPEAERFIAEKLRQQPYAPYAMAQAIFVQEQALANLQTENEQLRAELEHLSRRPQGGLLSGIFGRGPRPPEPAYNTPPVRHASPWGETHPHPVQSHGMRPGEPGPWGMMQARGGGGFLQTALSTAAGVAGGMMIANALSHAFGNDGGATADPSALADRPGDQGGDTDLAGITDPLYQNSDQTGQNFSDFGGDAGDGGDWS